MTRSSLSLSSAQTTAAAQALTVAQVVMRIKSAIGGQFPDAVWIQGQLSNVSYPSSGHIYFTMVDDQVTDRFGQRLVLPCAFFKGANQSLKMRLEDGMKVLCLGEVTTYEGRGQYQLRVLKVQPQGIGELQKAFEQMRERLQAEGLFDEARKRPIPTMPERIGLITSPTGSVVHDMLARLRGLFHLIVLPVRVQGEGAAEEIAAALELANRRRMADVLIVARGGGSLEELWAFNEERLARAIFRSEIPVISAVGHEDHWTISDYVADLRSSTPTHAAQQLAHQKQQLIEEAQDLIQQLRDGMTRWLETQEQGLDDLGCRLRLLHPLNQLARYEARVGELRTRLSQSMEHSIVSYEQRLQGLAGRLAALSPLAVLARGYTITRKAPGGPVVSDATTVRAGDLLETLLAKGCITSAVTTVTTTKDAHGTDQ